MQLKTRADFLRAQKGRRAHATGLVLETCATPERFACAGALRWGVTASRKVGGAVERNRAKRRLREAGRKSLPLSGRSMRDYVLIARAATLTREFSALLADLESALALVHAAVDREPKETHS
jgi:ribonuclease P protein component